MVGCPLFSFFGREGGGGDGGIGVLNGRDGGLGRSVGLGGSSCCFVRSGFAECIHRKVVGLSDREDARPIIPSLIDIRFFSDQQACSKHNS